MARAVAASSEHACPRGERLAAFVEGRVARGELAALEQHVAGCAVCRRVIAAAARGGDGARSVGNADTLVLDGAGARRLELGRVAERYVLLEQLGRGGMGTVFVAWDRELARRVALKILHPGVHDDRFQREAQALARLKHPGVVTVYDVGRDGDDVYITMELVEGRSLRRWLDGPRRWQRVLATFVSAGRGLAAAHRAGLVHRDFKPDNVLVGDDGSVRVADFGLARAIDEPVAAQEGSSTPSGERLTRTGAVVGTPRYMAPEQIGGRPADPRADQYSFCVALWEALFGEHPVLGERHGAPARGLVPAAVREALRRGLSRDPAARFPTMDALLASLDRRSSFAGGLVALGAAGAVTAAVALWTEDHNVARACQSSVPAEIAAGWGDAERARVRSAFLATGQLGAARAAESTVGVLDRHAAALAAMAEESCLATRVRRVQREPVYELRAACLARGSRGLRALVRELASADGAVVQRAEAAARSLPDVTTCADVEALSAPMQLPAEASRRAPVAAVRATLAEIEAMTLTGRNHAAIVRAAAALSMAGATGFAPLVADASLALGRAQRLAERSSEEVLEAAALGALAAGHDLTLADAMIELAATLERADARRPELDRWLRLAESALTRVGGGREVERRRAAVARVRTLTAIRDKRPAAAAEHARQALALSLRSQPETGEAFQVWIALTKALHQARRFAEAETTAREGIALALRIGLGPLQLAAAHDILSLVLADLGRWDEAIYSNRRAVELGRIALGPDSILEGAIEGNRGFLEVRRDRLAAAVEGIGRSVAIYTARLGPESPRVAMALSNMGALLQDLGRHEEARRALERSRDIIAAEKGPDDFRLIMPLGTLARSQASLGRFDEARAAAARSLALAERRAYHDNEWLTALRADASAHRDRPSAALPRYRKLLAANAEVFPREPRTFAHHVEAAEVAAAAGERRLAREWLTIAAELGTMDERTLRLLATLERELGDRRDFSARDLDE
jgi:tetratricopeptide (TPR) repeat protein/predicted Ser/Thr protein kinase